MNAKKSSSKNTSWGYVCCISIALSLSHSLSFTDTITDTLSVNWVPCLLAACMLLLCQAGNPLFFFSPFST